MRSRLRALWLSIKSSYWFIPSVLSFAAILLALGTIHLDRTRSVDWLSLFPWFEGSRPEGARAQLTVIASAMIAIASTVFAITIAAVAYASGNYGPRLLTNFMNNRGNQFSLGVFIATFVYNLVVLRVVQDPRDTSAADVAGETLTGFVPQLSMMVSAAFAILAIGVLVYFLHHIPASIRINTVLGEIGRKLIHDIERRFPIEGGSREPERRITGTPITARSMGYVEIIDFAELDEIAREEGLAIALRIRTGDFIHPHVPVVETSEAASEAIQQRILSCFSLGNSRTPTQDLEFLIDELVEIALRALSPGINDPFTAITSIHWMGAALAKLADRDLGEGPEQEGYDRARVQPLADDFDHFVRRSFGAVRASAATSPLAARMFLERLNGVRLGATSAQRREILVTEAGALVEQAELELKGPALKEVRETMRQLFQTL
ncbi:hypothetical protein BSL82_15925 [Tardibacter chloracetimidivorans]|uniref:DUF2254 domain-containing protein n=1 Tax=Tardibacter chloracetimidivorans TaxID=1921510 RepID=A0A1L3ZY90_9SPHN|nr:DUF2254 domain-containing protein [Tardibacter chloracetimidivorans]API60592.1 hypothetical protein BSL82_15925 [Tardibacter chloracetimidivorans]